MYWLLYSILLATSMKRVWYKTSELGLVYTFSRYFGAWWVVLWAPHIWRTTHSRRSIGMRFGEFHLWTDVLLPEACPDILLFSFFFPFFIVRSLRAAIHSRQLDAVTPRGSFSVLEWLCFFSLMAKEGPESCYFSLQ